MLVLTWAWKWRQAFFNMIQGYLLSDFLLKECLIPCLLKIVLWTRGHYKYSWLVYCKNTDLVTKIQSLANYTDIAYFMGIFKELDTFFDFTNTVHFRFEFIMVLENKIHYVNNTINRYYILIYINLLHIIIWNPF